MNHDIHIKNEMIEYLHGSVTTLFMNNIELQSLLLSSFLITF